jgi:hypothetical protein
MIKRILRLKIQVEQPLDDPGLCQETASNYQTDSSRALILAFFVLLSSCL